MDHLFVSFIVGNLNRLYGTLSIPKLCWFVQKTRVKRKKIKWKGKKNNIYMARQGMERIIAVKKEESAHCMFIVCYYCYYFGLCYDYCDNCFAVFLFYYLSMDNFLFLFFILFLSLIMFSLGCFRKKGMD